MAYKLYFISSLLLITSTLAAVPVETQPSNKDEFAYVQTLKSGARPISRKEKATEDERPFETSHKLPLSVTYLLNQEENESTRQKRAAPAPAPAGSIKIDPLKLIQKYKSEIKINPDPTPTTKASRTVAPLKRGRVKKDAAADPLPTSPRPSLTSGAPPTPRNLDLDVVPQASGDKQRSKIQIKKGPNGQEYEYEYVYYYYDEDENKSTTEKVYNSHDGPARKSTSNSGKDKTSSKESSSNEVIPSGRGRPRGRQLEEEELVGEERLPPSTRFPPRSRNFASTSSSEEEFKVTTHGRDRSRATTAGNAPSKAESASEESQSRSRPRGNIRRGSLDLIDNESFNTHSGNSASEPQNSGPSFPSDLPPGPVRFLGAIPNERVTLQDQTPDVSTEQAATETDLTALVGDTTTVTISPMDKVALDLYAILQGTQKLSGEEEIKDDDTSNTATTTIQTETTEIPTTEYVTITTTTTTTTPEPTTTTTTTTEAPAFGRGRFRGSANRKKHGSTTSAPSSEAPHGETKPKSRFNRPSFNRPKPGGRTTSEPVHEEKVDAEDVKPLSKSRPTSRSRYGAAKPKPTSTESSEETSSAASKPAFARPRPGFSARGRGRNTTPSAAEERVSLSEEVDSASSTTARSKIRLTGNNNVKPLRPGLRINLRGGLGSHATSAATEASLQESSGEEVKSAEDSKEEAPTSSAPADKNPLNRLRNRQRLTPTAAPKQKVAASATVQVRRVNPLIGRRRLGSTEPSSSEAPVEAEPTEPTISEENDSTETSSASSTTTEEPKGLNKLLAGRRKLNVKHANN